jgi:PPM family protein phosphatase
VSDYQSSAPGVVLARAGISDLGCRRKINEDCMGYIPAGTPDATNLLIVADGVGGSAAGEVASQLAVDTVSRVFFAQGEPANSAQALYDALQQANDAIFREAATDPMKAGMATTCTVAAVKGETIILGHVGDCRAYMAVGGELIQLTADHSMANDYLREGKPLPPEKESLANVLTRWLGHEGDPAAELSELMQFNLGSTLVMCSDGLTKVVQQDEILHAVSMYMPDGACKRLVDLARERGGPDNITVQVARLNRT